jgi:hypothetical protein
MKTAISSDDGLLREADETARLMGLSRSRLFAMAVGDFAPRQAPKQMRLLTKNTSVYISVHPWPAFSLAWTNELLPGRRAPLIAVTFE